MAVPDQNPIRLAAYAGMANRWRSGIIGRMSRFAHHFTLRQFALWVSAFGLIYLELCAAVRAPDSLAVLPPASPAAGRGGFVLLPVYLFPGRESLSAETASAVVGRLYLPETLPLELPLAHHTGTDPHHNYGGSGIKHRWLPAAGGGGILAICGRSGWILSGPPSPCCMPWGYCRQLQP